MVLSNIFLLNFFTISLTVGLAILAISNRCFDKRSNGLFIIFISIVFVLDMADICDNYCSTLSHLSIFRYISSSLGYTLRPASLAIILSILQRKKKANIYIWIPVMLVFIISITSKYTHLMFWFCQNNTFNRGPLGYISHIVSGIYMVAIIIVTLRVHKYLYYGEIITIFFICTISIVATVIESLYVVKFILPGAMIISCTLYYLIIYIQFFKRDILTGVLNRSCLFADCQAWNNQSFIIISVDLNGLKDINDNHGHKAGDAALCALADSLMSASSKQYHVYRIGGDEFVVIGKDKSHDNARLFTEKTRKELSKAGYMASFGYALHKANGNFDDAYKKADARMYTDKKNYKHRI